MPGPVIKSMDESIKTSGQSLDKNPSGAHAHALPVPSMLVHSVLQEQVQTQDREYITASNSSNRQACRYIHTACWQTSLHKAKTDHMTTGTNAEVRLAPMCIYNALTHRVCNLEGRAVA